MPVAKGLIPAIRILAMFMFLSLFAVKSYGQEGLSAEALARGKACAEKGEYEQAIKELTDSIDSDYRNAEAFYNRALVYYKEKDLDKAIIDFSKAIDIDGSNATYYYNRGIAYYYKDYLDKAIADWDKALEYRPDDAATYQKRGFGYLKKKDYDKAWEDVHKIEELGYKPDAKFVEDLMKASGRDK